MGFDPDRGPPFFFCKPNDDKSVVPVDAGTTVTLPYPSNTSNYHFEIELVVAIRKGGRDIDSADAASHICGYAVGLDMTRRDLQMRMREQGRPWEIGKAFDYSAPIGPLHPIVATGAIEHGAISLEVDGKVRQSSDVSHLIWSVSETIANLSTQEQLEHRANFDALTGLANRNLLHDRLRQALSYASRFKKTVWVAFIDLDQAWQAAGLGKLRVAVNLSGIQFASPISYKQRPRRWLNPVSIRPVLKLS
jgi:hypothetical protein